VDINPDCKLYERDGFKVFIGDQADRSFWRDFCTKVPKLDIVIDDGGRKYEQQVVSLDPFVVVVEKNRRADVPELVASTHGTEWLGGVRR
jgi:hypothetical protein